MSRTYSIPSSTTSCDRGCTPLRSGRFVCSRPPSPRPCPTKCSVETCLLVRPRLDCVVRKNRSTLFHAMDHFVEKMRGYRRHTLLYLPACLLCLLYNLLPSRQSAYNVPPVDMEDGVSLHDSQRGIDNSICTFHLSYASTFHVQRPCSAAQATADKSHAFAASSLKGQLIIRRELAAVCPLFDPLYAQGKTPGYFMASLQALSGWSWGTFQP